jgi:hypothetical protein
MHPIHRLLKAGLDVVPLAPTFFASLIEDLQKGERIETVLYCSVTTNYQSPDTHRSVIKVYWHVLQKRWEVALREGIPGPIPGDFICYKENFDQVVDVLLNYFFGSAVIIHDWIVPLHKHPELDSKQVEIALTQAVSIRRASFQAVYEQAQENMVLLSVEDIWERAQTTTFLEFQHQKDPHRICYLRRNAQDAYSILD